VCRPAVAASPSGRLASSSVGERPGGEVAGGLRALLERPFEELGLPALEEYVAIACLSPAFDPAFAEHGELRRAAELLAGFVRRHGPAGAAVEVLELPGRSPLLFAHLPATRAGAATLVYGHLDKQPALGPWRDGLAPFAATREGDRLYGRGVADDGYAAIAATLALRALEEAGLRRGPVVLLVEGSEESGSPDLAAYLDALAPRIGSPGLVVCLDSGAATYDRLWVTTSLRGLVNATLTVRVLEQGVHSGLAGGVVPSSFRLARHLLERVEDGATGEVRLAPCRVTPPEHRRAEIAALAAELGEDAAGSFPTVPGLELAGASPAERLERLAWHPALEVTGAEGLPGRLEAGNVLRPLTALRLSLRLPPTCDASRAAEALGAALTADPPAGAAVTLEVEEVAEGFDAPPTAPWLAAALDAASRAAFGAPPGALGLGGTIPFLPALARRFPDAQLLATGVLGPGSGAHGPDEFLHVPTAVSLTAVLAALLAAAP